jgi:hypothetical protein
MHAECPPSRALARRGRGIIAISLSILIVVALGEAVSETDNSRGHRIVGVGGKQ